MAAGLALGAGACKSPTYKKGSATASGIQKAADRIGALQGQMDLVLTNLNDLVHNPQPDLRPQYKSFSSSVSKLESMAKDVSQAAKSMASKGDSFFARWDKELAQIQNEDIKARGQSRKEEVAKRFDAIKEHYETARAAYEPFGSDLRDLQKSLGADLTKEGLAALKEPVAKALESSKPLKASLSTLVEDFRALGVSMSPVTPPQQ